MKMDNLEKELTELLKNESGLEASKDETARKEIAQMEGFFERFVTNVQRARLVFWIFFVLGLIIMFVGLTLLFNLRNPNELAVALFMALVGFNSTILIKLWYWTMSTKFDVLKEIKEVQLQITELAEKKPPSAD